MTTLEKAVLEELDKAGKAKPKSAVPVQFNPTSLKLQMSNSTDGATSRGRQVQQYNGSASTSLSVQLEFDTADEGTTAAPVDVRTKTAQVARFVLPGGTGSKQAPPRVQFRWGTVIVGGVMTSMSEELSLFSTQGVPLRASVTVDIKQQDPKFEALERGPGANPDTAAPPAGKPTKNAGPGTVGSGGGAGGRTAEALDGESAADFLARNGLDPSAWRSIAGPLDDPLSLPAGLAVDFSASLSVDPGVGVSAGFAAELDVSAGASLGLEAGNGAGVSAGLALTGAGGVTAAAETLAAGEAATAADLARAAFASPASPAAAPATDSRAPLRTVPSARTLGPVPAAPRPLPPRADPRATSFGRGVPLRDRVVPPEVSAGTGGWVVVGHRPPVAPATGAGGARRAGDCSSSCGCGGRTGCSR
ncbi:CIS tube protein [Actinopolymorpha singaporensis]|uniref:Contractile injection system tube protein N-terminal domain-containing protein n=1 Tax=Actinopolymorpha singaporensis TaxID=117157 RepID=A0A1H1UYW3_9ACTN|nr:hypothetical protein [Actinopolymorpha singaporensis]SDS77560.1 hypothetical protein SAMN04489717_3829 [Actinopolymorpha singaporensis]